MYSFRWNAHSDPGDHLLSDVRPGHFYAINRTADLAETVGRFYEVWSNQSEQNLKSGKGSSTNSTASPVSKLFFSIPYEDLEGKGLVMSISQAFYDEVGCDWLPVNIIIVLSTIRHLVWS